MWYYTPVLAQADFMTKRFIAHVTLIGTSWGRKKGTKTCIEYYYIRVYKKNIYV